MKFRDTLTYIGMALVIVGVVCQEAELPSAWCMAFAGGILMFLMRMHTRLKEDMDLQSSRLCTILMTSSVLICVSSYLMMEGKGYWLLPILISAALELYVGFRMK